MTNATPPLLLVHGSPGTGDVWNAVRENLSNDFDVAAPTLPGYEDEPAVSPPPLELAAFAESVETAVAEPESPIDLLAHSFGGVIALRVALRNRVHVRRMILLEPVAIPVLKTAGDGDTFEEMRSVFDAYDDRHCSGDPNAVSTMIDFWFGQDAFERLPAPVQSHLQSRTALNLRDVKATLREQYTAAELAALDIPVLVVCGSKSPQPAHRIASALCELLGNTRIESLADADHAMLPSQPGKIADLTKRFLRP